MQEMTQILARDELHDRIRPKNFDPADVQVVGFMDTQLPKITFDELRGLPGDIADRLIAEANEYYAQWRARNVELFGREFPGTRCEHCGARIRWAGIVKYLPTGQHFVVGETCATERMELGSRIDHLSRLERMSAEARERRYALLAARAAFYREYPAEAEFLFDDTREYNDFFNSLQYKLEKYGELTERQIAAITRQLERDAARKAKFAEESAKLADVEPLPEGRREIEGVVVSTKIVEGDYGTSYKMLVKQDDGNKVYGTIPAALDSLWQDMQEREAVRVKFTATVERSTDDEHFGFFKRPTKATQLLRPEDYPGIVQDSFGRDA